MSNSTHREVILLALRGAKEQLDCVNGQLTDAWSHVRQLEADRERWAKRVADLSEGLDELIAEED